jgi:hypothetical protein
VTGDLAKLGVFVLFVALAVAAGGRRTSGRRIDVFVAFVLATSLLAGLLQKESWPFTNWALVHHLAPTRFENVLELEAVDADGRSWPLDARALQPLSLEELRSWLTPRLDTLSDGERAALGSWLLARAEQARQRARDGRRVGSNERWLGPLAAPYHFTRPRPWDDPAAVPDRPLVALRVYADSWDVEARLHAPGRRERRLAWEYRPVAR